MARSTRRVADCHQGSSTPQNVEVLAAQLIPGGVVLPASRVLGPLGHPVIWIDSEAHEHRQSVGAGPISRYDDIARQLDESPEELPPSAVRFLAFVSTTDSETAVRDLTMVRAYCRGVLLVAEADVPGEPKLSEFDYLGITVASVKDDGVVSIHVLGDPGRKPGSALAPAWARHREEQLYAAALTRGEW
jgi:hypothetical protein